MVMFSSFSIFQLTLLEEKFTVSNKPQVTSHADLSAKLKKAAQTFLNRYVYIQGCELSQVRFFSLCLIPDPRLLFFVLYAQCLMITCYVWFEVPSCVQNYSRILQITGCYSLSPHPLFLIQLILDTPGRK